MPAPDLKPQVPGETADTSNSAAQAPSLPTPSTPADERQAMLLTLSKQTVAVITEALPALTGSDLFSLRDLEAAGSGRKGVFEALEVEDKRREALSDADGDAQGEPESLEDEVVRLREANANLNRRLQQWEDDWTAANLDKPLAPSAVQAAGQAVLTDQGWVVPEPPKKG